MTRTSPCSHAGASFDGQVATETLRTDGTACSVGLGVGRQAPTIVENRPRIGAARGRRCLPC
jgi:hypothetical protein